MVFDDAESLKILGVFPMLFQSHHILARGLMQGLAQKGHNVTVITVFSETTPSKNGAYKEIFLTEFLKNWAYLKGNNVKMRKTF